MNNTYFGKYLFPSLEIAKSKKNSLNNIKSYGFALKKEGEEAVFDENGILISESTITGKYQLDVAWIDLLEKNHPNGWGEYAIDILTEGNNFVKGFSYQEHKIIESF